MAITINGSGTITGLSAGGLPDASVTNDDLAGSIADGKITGLSSSKLSGALPSIDGSSLTGVGVDGITSSANATAISISADEEVTMPLQPCFLAHLTSRASNVTGAGAGFSTSGKTFTEVYDIGSNFSNGLFTAPVTGKYILYGTLYFINTASANNQTIIYVETSNRGYNALRSHGNNIFPYQGNFSFSIVADMDASDTFYINCNMYGGSSNTVHVEGASTPRNSTFMGATLIA